MAISRNQMGKQIMSSCGGTRKTKKMALGGIALAKKLGAGAIPTVAMARSLQSGQPEGILQYSPAAMLMQRPERKAKGMKKGGKVRGDGMCQRGKTKGRFV